MAAAGPVAGVSPATEKYTLERDVATIKDNLPIALEYEDLESSSYAQLAERVSVKPGRGACLLSVFLTPILGAHAVIVSLGKFLTGHAFWSSGESFKQRFANWGKSLYIGVVGAPLLAVISEVAVIAGVIEPRLFPKVAPLMQAVSLIPKQQMIREAALDLLRGGKAEIGVAVGVLQTEAHDKRVIHRIDAMIKSDSNISVDAIVERIFTHALDQRGAARSGKDEA